MQQRFHISWHVDFKSALEAKQESEKADPDHEFQIRKKSDKKFELVIRVPEDEQVRTPEKLVKTRRQR